jgi:hypothetical protein
MLILLYLHFIVWLSLCNINLDLEFLYVESTTPLMISIFGSLYIYFNFFHTGVTFFAPLMTQHKLLCNKITCVYIMLFKLSFIFEIQ